MKKILLLIAFLLSAGIASGQGVRFGDGQPIATAQTPGGPLSAGAFSTINFCGFPSSSVPCTNKVTTYTDITLATACPTSTQVVLAGTNSCTASTDGYGNWGVWVPAGTYVYTVTLAAGGGNLGPFTVTLAAGGGGGGGMVYPGAGVPNSTGTAWGPSYAVGTAPNDLVQMNSGGQLPAVSGALLTNLPSANQQLSNLVGPTALSQPLLCATPSACQFGITSNPFGGSWVDQLNDSTYNWWIDASGNMFVHSITTLPLGGPYIASGSFGTSAPPSVAGSGILYCGDSASLDCLIYLNGASGLYWTGFQSATQTSHAPVLYESLWGLTTTAAGTSGQCFMSNGASADPSYQACPSASVPTGTFQTNGTNNTTSTSLNMKPSTVNAANLVVTPTNVGTNQETYEVTSTGIPNAALANPSTTVNGTTCTLGSTCASRYPPICAKFSTTDTLTANGALQTFATTCSIPANTLGTNNIIRVTLTGQTTTSASPPTGAWKITLGGTTVYSQAANAMPANLTNIPNEGITLLIQGEAAPSGSSNVVTTGTGRDLDGAWFGGSSTTGTTQPVALATNGALTLAFSWTTSASDASTNLKLLQLLVEQVN